jgi:hypothetical protein
MDTPDCRTLSTEGRGDYKSRRARYVSLAALRLLKGKRVPRTDIIADD